MVRWFDGARPLAYPVVPELEVLESREVRKELNDMSILERIRETQGERL